MDRWANQSGGRETAVTRVLAISPVLPVTEKSNAREQLEEELAWIAGDAPVGSVTVVVDALECVPIARLEAVLGVARIRKKALVKPALAIRKFFNMSHARVKDDGSIHFPRLAQTAKQWGLSAGSHVVVLGNPLFLNDGKDKFFSMTDGRVPSDGCLFEDPQLNLYSIVGREKSLTGQYWHLGWSDDAVFEDDTHRQAVLRFWFLYFQTQSALLVTARPSFAAATHAAREGATDPLMYVDPDSSARAAMVKIIKVQHEDEVKILPKATDDVQPQVDAVHARQQVDPEVTVDQAQLEESNAQVEEDTQNELVDIDANASEVARDQHGNVQGSDKDLIIDGQMMGQKIVLATFFSDEDVEGSPLTGALTAKGFAVERMRHPLPPLSAFESMLDESQQLWLWSSGESSKLPTGHLQAIVERWKAGKLALCLLADNTPYTAEASLVLSALSPGCAVSGGYLGEHELHAWLERDNGFDPASPLFHNITSLFEGTTVSSMTGPGLVPVCYASNGSPLIATLQQEGSSRLIIHGGFTSFYKRFWNDAGVSRFAVNCAGWLSGADAKIVTAAK